MEFYNRNWRVPSSWNGTEDNNNKVSNYSMSFDGSSEYVDLTQQDLGTVNSFSFWLKRANTDSVGETIFGEPSNAFKQCVNIDWAGNTLYFKDPSNNRNTWNTLSSVNNTNWHHYLITRNGEETVLYLDGVSQGIGTVASALTGNTLFRYLGVNYSSNSQFFEGQLDHLSIFDYALSQAQVTELYGSSSTGVGNPMAITNGRKPIAYYPLGDYSAYNGEYLVANSALSDYVFDFDGSDDHIDCGTDSTLNITGSITISCWIKSSNTDANRKLIIKDNMSSSRSYQINTNHASLGPYTYFWLGGGNIKSVNTGTPNQIVDGNWHHLVAIFKSGEYIRMYIDGVQAGNTNVTETTLDSSTASFIIASNGAGGTTRVDGELSNAAIFNIALPATGTESVESLYNYGTPPDISSYSGLQGFWKLDAGSTYNSSTTTWNVPDESSNSNNGTSSGMTAANLVQSNLNILSPYSRYALNFDGVSGNKIDLGTIASLNSVTEFTVSFWSNFDSGQINDGVIFTNRVDNNNRIVIYRYNTFIYFHVNSSGSNQGNVTAPSIGSWTHISMIYDGSGLANTDRLKVYYNGVEQTLSYGGIIPATTGTYSTSYIGARGDGSNEYKGDLSNVSIWNAALTLAQVTEIYNEGKPSNLNNHSAYSNLVSWWQLGENSSFNSNWTVIDEKGTNNGTSVNMAEDDLVNGVGTTANGLSSGMGGADNIVGNAPQNSTGNAISYGMGVDAKSTDVPS